MKNKIGFLLLLFLGLTHYSCKMDNQQGSTNGSDSTTSTGTLPKLTAGVHAWPGGGTIYLADKKGFFKKHGVDVDIKKIENFDTKRSSMIGGSIDLDIANTMDQLVIYANVGFPITIIGVSDESTGGDGLICKESIQTIQDLKGKTIAYAEASPSDFFLRYVLKQNGIDPSEVKLKPVADPQIAGNAAISKTVDAAVTYEPFLSQADDTEGLKSLVTTAKYPTLIPGLILADNKKVAKNPVPYQKFMDAWFEAIDYYYAHKEESEKIIAEGMGMDVAEVSDILSTVQLQTRAQNRKLIQDATKDDLYELIESISVFWKENNFIDKDIDGKALVSEELITGNYAVQK